MPDVIRVATMTAVAVVLLLVSTPIAQALGEPAIAPWGMFAGLATFGVALSHVFRRALFPYLDLRATAYRACTTSEGAGRVFLGVCIVLASLLLLMGGVAKAGEVPPGAVQYMPVLKDEIRTNWPGMHMPSALAAQVEQESCVSLKSARCWNPRAELRTSREQGVGFGQVTRTARFDALAELREQFPEQLRGWSWSSATLYDPHYQLRALVLMDRRNWGVITGTATPDDRLAMALTAYNGGLGGLSSDRRMCAATRGCDPGRWFGHVERTSLKSRTVVGGYGRSFFAINRAYAPAVLFTRRPKYVPYMDGV